MNLFSNITRGGQLQIHQLRMFQQIFCFALVISLITSVLMLGYRLNREITSIQARYSYEFAKAKLLLSLSNVIQKHAARQTIDIRCADSTEYLCIDIINHPSYKKAAYLTTLTLKQQIRQTVIEFIASFALIFSIWFFYGKKHKKTDIIKGKRFISPSELAKSLKQQKRASDIKIAELPLVKNRELQHVLVAGTTGSGKSNLFNILLPQIRKRPNKAIIIDVTGEYIAKFYNPDTDFIFNPLDARSVRWNIWCDCHLESHYEAIAASLIPSKKYQSDDIWDASSRVVLVEVLKKLAATDENTISKLLSIIMQSKIGDLETYLQGTNAAKLISSAADKTTLSILMNLNTHIATLKLLQHEANYQQHALIPQPLDQPPDHDREHNPDQNPNQDHQFFSMRGWISNENNNDSWIFISARSDQLDLLRPLITTITDIAMNALLSLPPNNKRRIWFILDELAKLNKLPSLASALAESRKYGGCIVAGIQSVGQLTENYGYALAQSITDMFNSFFFFRCQNPQTTEWIAKILGVVEQEELHEQLSYGANVIKDGVSFSKQTKSKHLVLPIEIANLNDLEAYVKYAGFEVTKIKTNYQDLASKWVGFEVKL